MQTDIALLPDDTWQFLYAALRNGLGLSTACAGLQLDIQAMSTFLRRAPVTLANMQREIATGYKAHIGMLATAQSKGNGGTWASTRRRLTEDFVNTVGLWEDFCARAELTPDLLAAAYTLHRAPLEVATVVGCTRRELLLYVQADVNLQIYLQQAGFAFA